MTIIIVLGVLIVLAVFFQMLLIMYCLISYVYPDLLKYVDQKMKKEKYSISFFISKLTIELYWPKIMNNSSDFGIVLPTQILYKKLNTYNEWWVTRALTVKLFGFGLGLAWKHYDNPNIKSTV